MNLIIIVSILHTNRLLIQIYRTTKVDEVEITARLTSAQSSRPHFKKYFSQVSGERYQQDLHWAHPETGKVVKLH